MPRRIQPRTASRHGKSASFGELAARAAQMPVPKNIALKDPSAFKLIGKPVRRLDNSAKVTGSAAYTIDVLPPGLLYASVTMCPTLGGKVARFDGAAAQSMPGVHKMIAINAPDGGLGSQGAGSGGVAVIADTPYHAMRALKTVTVEWDHGPAANLSSKDVINGLAQTLDTQNGKVDYESGDIEAALKSAAKTITAEYRVPFLAHAAMEPMNCTVQFKDGAATAWVSTQDPGFARDAIAKVLGIKADKVTVVIPFLGGGFGRRYLLDFISQAAAIAREAEGTPVQTIWSREQDMTHDYYRPAFVSRHKAGLDAQGKLTAWQATSAGSSMGAPSFMDGSGKGAFDSGYEFPNARIAHQPSDSLVPVGIWRSVSHSYNAFFTESFIDEAAFAAGQDPVAFRAALMAGKPRFLRVLHRAADFQAGASRLRPRRTGLRKRGVSRCTAASAASSLMWRRCRSTPTGKSACIASRA